MRRKAPNKTLKVYISIGFLKNASKIRPLLCSSDAKVVVSSSAVATKGRVV